MLDDMQNNRGCSSKMALAPIDSQDPDLACRDNVCTYHVLNNTLCQSWTMYRRFFLFFSLFYIGTSSIIIITLAITLILNDCSCIALVPSVLPFPLPKDFPTPGAGGLCVPLPTFMYLLSFLLHGLYLTTKAAGENRDLFLYPACPCRNLTFYFTPNCSLYPLSFPTLCPVYVAVMNWRGCIHYNGTPLKGTVSPEIGLYFRYLEIKSVLSAESLTVFTLFYFLVPEIFQI